MVLFVFLKRFETLNQNVMLQQFIMCTLIQVRKENDQDNSFLCLTFSLVGDPSFYENTLRSALGPNFSTEGFTIEKKADATYKIVSAGERTSNLLLIFP